MKTKEFFKILLITIVFAFGVTTSSFAQDKADVVTMLDGQTKEGHVVAMGTDMVTFKYSGEDLEYQLKKANINKIDFASGRSEVFTPIKQAPISNSSVSTSADRKNKVAVLPFEYITNDSGIMADPMHTQIQTKCIASLRENTSILLKIQDPMTTNALLAQNNISVDQLKAVSPKDLAVKLGVEYVVYGSVSVENKGTISTGSEVTTYKDKENRDYDKDHSHKKSSGTEITSGSSSTRINYDSRVDLNIYTDQGNNVYSKSKRAFGSGLDSYKSALNYLVKRTPFGSKAKH